MAKYKQKPSRNESVILFILFAALFVSLLIFLIRDSQDTAPSENLDPDQVELTEPQIIEQE